MADLVGQTAGYLQQRAPQPHHGGGGPLGHLNPMQFAKSIGGEGEAAVGGAAEELAPLALAL